MSSTTKSCGGVICTPPSLGPHRKWDFSIQIQSGWAPKRVPDTGGKPKKKKKKKKKEKRKRKKYLPNTKERWKFVSKVLMFVNAQRSGLDFVERGEVLLEPETCTNLLIPWYNYIQSGQETLAIL